MIEFRPIGIIHTPFKKQKGTPIQGVFAPQTEGKVEVYNQFTEGLQDIEGFSYIYLLYFFHLAEGFSLKVVPYLDTKPHGVFTTRAPRRPNPIGLSIVQLVKREKNILLVRGIDILDGTPLLDIKPYFPRFDSVGDVKIGWMEGKLPDEKGNVLADDRF